jgi:DNA-directed RNA polymerase specialized sigma24 family protein
VTVSRTIEAGADRATLDSQCEVAVARLLARHGWQLLEREEFVRRTVAHLRAGIAGDPRRAATYTYSLALHAACSGVDGPARRERGYTELHRYLYDSARRRYPDVCDDATQRALEAVFTGFARCRQPGAFLAFALQCLMDAARVARRPLSRGEQSLATPVGDNGRDTLGDLLPDARQPDPAEVVLDGERRARLGRYADEFLRKHPRARDQLAALWLKYIEGLDDATIGRRLGKPVSSVYVLRSRAIAKLHAEPRWRALAGECGHPAGESPGGTTGDPR